MINYIVRRSLQALPVLFLICIVTFLLMMAAPGGPTAQFLQNTTISPEAIDRYLARWCLTQNPDLVESLRSFGGWLGVYNCETGGFLSAQGLPNFLPTFLGGGDNGLVHLDLGLSMSYNRPVLEVIGERVPATFILMSVAFLIWVSVALTIGVIAAVRRYSVFDQSVTLFSYIFYSLPTFWLGLVLIFIFAVQLRWLPAQGIVDARNSPAPFNTPQYWTAFWQDPWPQIMDIGRHLVLPVMTLVAVNIAADSRFVRSSMLDTLSQDYVRTARAKGLPRKRVVMRHAFRNALLPIITAVTLEIAFLFSGAIVTETIFSWPGMGRLYIDGIESRDYFLLMGIVIISSVFVLLMNIVADIVYAVADPRIRY